MCPACEGLGRVSTIDINQLVDVKRSLNEGAITVPNFAVDSWYWQIIAQSGFVDPDVKLTDYTAAQWEDFLHKAATKVKVGSHTFTYEGLVVKVQRSYLAKDRESMQPHIRASTGTRSPPGTRAPTSPEPARSQRTSNTPASPTTMDGRGAATGSTS